MSPRDVFRDWVAAHALRFVVYAIMVGIAWGILTAQVAAKASQSQVDALDMRLTKTADAIGGKLDAMMYLLCRDPRNATDSQCDLYRKRP